jgi:uncharacterized membrane protein YedE/YeeE
MSITAYMTLHGVFGVFRSTYLDPVQIELKTSAYLPNLLAALVLADTATASQVLAIAIPLLLLITVLVSSSVWNRKTMLGGISIGLTVAATWWIMFQLAYIAEHPNTLEAAYLGSYSNRAEGLSFVAPYAYSLEWLIFFSDHSRVLTVGVVSCLGVVLGATGNALWEKKFRWETFQGVEDTANHLVGAMLMGIGGILAWGCTVGQGLSGVSTLSLASLIILGSIVMGAMVALRYQMWRIERTFKN